MEFMISWIDAGWTFIKFVLVTCGVIFVVMFAFIFIASMIRSIKTNILSKKAKKSSSNLKTKLNVVGKDFKSFNKEEH